jgi:hypothetical protein
MSDLEQNPLYSRSHPLGRQLFDNPFLNIFTALVAGQYGIPQPTPGQGMYENFLVRERSKHFMGIQMSSMMDNMLFKKAGISNNSYLKFLSPFFASPESSVNKMLAPYLGGNPVGASMQLYAGLAGANTMGNFGRLGAVTSGETQRMMSSLADNFYTSQKYESTAGAGKELLDKEIEEKLLSTAKQAAEQPNASKQTTMQALGNLGLDFLNPEQDIDDQGALTFRGTEKIKKSKFTSGSNTNTESYVRDTKLRQIAQRKELSNLTNIVDQADLDADQNTSTQITQRLKSRLLVPQEDINDLMVDPVNMPGVFDKEKLKSKLSSLDKQIEASQNTTSYLEEQYNKSVQAAKSPDYIKEVGVKEEIDKAASKRLLNVADEAAKRADKSKKTTMDLLAKEGYIPGETHVDEQGALTAEGRSRISSLRVTAGSNTPEERAARENQINRKNLGRSKQSIIQDIVKQVDEGNVELDANLSKAVTEKIKTQFDISQEDIENLMKDSKKGILDKDKLKSKLSDLNKKIVDEANATTFLEDQYNKSAPYAQAGGRFTGFDFVKSRGFKLEDITSGFVKASELRMMGDVKNMPMATAMTRFSSNAGGAMSAARDIFGDLTGGELVSKISDMLGSSAADLGSVEGSAKIEELLRKTSATARVAGVSIKAMLSIIDDTKELLSSNPQLQYTNSAAIATVVNEATLDASALGAQMSSKEFRAEGGTTGLLTKRLKEGVAFAQSPLGSSLSAVLNYAKSSKNKEAETLINDLVASGQYTGRNLLGQQGRDIAAKLNMSYTEFIKLANDPLQAQLGLKNQEIAEKIYGAEGRNLSANAAYDVFARANVSKEKIQADYAKYMKENPEGTVTEFESRYLLPLLNDSNRSFYMASRNPLLENLRESNLSAPEKAALKKERDDQAQTDKDLAKEFDKIRASTTTQVLNALMKGDKLEGYDIGDAAEALAGIIATPNRTDREIRSIKQGFRESVEALSNAEGNFKKLGTADKATVVGGINKLLDLKRINLKETSPEKATQIKDLSEQDITDVVDVFKNNPYRNPVDASKRLKDLEELFETRESQKETPKDQAEAEAWAKQKKELNALKILKNFDFEGMEKISSSGVTGFISTITESARVSAKKKIMDDYRKKLVTDFEATTQKTAEGTSIDSEAAKSILTEYKEKGGLNTLLKDLEANPEIAEQRFPGNPIVAKAQDLLSKLQSSEAKHIAEDTKKDSQKDLIKSMDGLTSMISGGGAIASTLRDFFSALKTI